MTQLSAEDVRRLSREPSREVRAETARKVARAFADRALSPTERNLALDIFRHMVHDTEMRVRWALAEVLHNCPTLPREVAIVLARDVIEVARPMLEHSVALSDEDLIDILTTTQSVDVGLAIARRPVVTEPVSAALVAGGAAPVISAAIANRGARFSPATLETVVTRYAAAHEDIARGLVHRPKLPIAIAERLVALVSDQLRGELMERGRLSQALSEELADHGREKATIELIGPSPSPEQAQALVLQLQKNGRLTASIIMRALWSGDLAFFVAALSLLTRTSYALTYDLVSEPQAVALEKMLAAARLPKRMFDAIRIGISVVLETQLDGGPHDRERFQRRVIERFLTQCESIDGDSLDHLLSRLSQPHPTESASAVLP